MEVIHAPCSLLADCSQHEETCPALSLVSQSSALHECSAPLLSQPLSTPASCFKTKNEERQLASQPVHSLSPHQRLFRSILVSDIRHTYPSLVFNAINSGNLRHLAQVLARILRKDCVVVRSAVDESGVLGMATAYSLRHRYAILSDCMSIASVFPDGAFVGNTFKLHRLAHVPDSFRGVPLSLLDDISQLNEFLLRQALKAGQSPRPGNVIIGQYSFQGSAVFQPARDRLSGSLQFVPLLVSSQSIQTTFLDTSFNCSYVVVLAVDDRIARFESYAHTATATVPAKDSRHPFRIAQGQPQRQER